MAMPARPKFNAVATPRGWVVSIPDGMSKSGTRERRRFAIEKDAKEFAARLRDQYHAGQRGGLIPLALALQAQEAADLLAPLGISIVEAARAAVAKAAATGTSETFAARYDRALRENEGIWRDRYARDMAKIPRWVGRVFMALPIHEITPSTITAALRSHGSQAQSTVDMRAARVSAIIGHRTRHRKTSEIEILTTAQCAAMLRACESPVERRAVALLLFAGVRPDAEDGEIARLDWEAVGAHQIYIAAEVAKTGTDRHIPITPRLARLLRGHDTSGPVVPVNWKRVYQRIRKAASITGQDITRHTFASHFLAAFGMDAARQAMGHSQTSATILRHYRRAVTEAAGRRFFGVR